MNNDLLADKKVPASQLLRRTLKYVRKERGSLFLAFLLIIINVALGVLLPRITGYFTDYISGNNIVLTAIWVTAVAVLVISIINQAILLLESMILTKAGQRIVYELRMEVFEHIENMSQNQFNDMAVGSLVTRVCSYTSQLSEFFTNILVRVIRDIFTIVIVYVWMMVLSWKLGLLLLAVVVLVFIISFVFSKVVHSFFSKERRQLSGLNTYINESLSGMKIIQIFNQENRYAKKFHDKNHPVYKVPDTYPHAPSNQTCRNR